MDSYVDRFQEAGGSLVMLAKGNRSKAVTEACKKHGGFYLGSIGGPAARLAQDCIKKVEVLEYPELGMEAVWRIEVEDFPAFIVVDDKGNDFFTDPSGGPVPVSSPPAPDGSRIARCLAVARTSCCRSKRPSSSGGCRDSATAVLSSTASSLPASSMRAARRSRRTAPSTRHSSGSRNADC